MTATDWPRNGLHVGPSAHRLMGTQTYREIEEKWMR